MLGRGFHTLLRNVPFSSPIDAESHSPPPLGAIRLSPPLANIVFFGLSLLSFPRGFKTHLLWVGFSPTPTSDSHHPMTGFDIHCPVWGFPCELSLKGFKICLVWRRSNPTPTSVSHRPLALIPFITAQVH